jgi:2-hydroxychromene-2-carboxylate isomerase
MPKHADFYFDLSSPYSYLAATQLAGIAQRTGATISWKPMVLGAVFKSVGNHMPANIAAKARFMLADLGRWAKQYGVEFTFNTSFPINAIKAMRLILVADQEGKAPKATLAAFRTLWVNNGNVATEPELRALATEMGLDADRAMAAIENPEIKDRLRAYTEEAIAAGVFGAPALVVGDELYWGNDRLHHVEAALKD